MLTKELFQLAQESLKVFETWKKKARPMKMVMIKHKITEFHLGEKGSRWTSTDEPYEKLDWSVFVFDLVEKHIISLPIFQEIVGTALKDYPEVFKNLSPEVNKTKQAEYWLGNLVRTILYEQIDGKLTQPRLVELIALFENELNCGPLQYILKSYITGVYLKKDSLVLDDNTLIRKPKAQDLEYEYHAYTPPFYGSQMRSPSVILEIRMSLRKEADLWNKRERILSILQLYRLGSVYSLWHDHWRNSVMWSMGTSHSWSHSGVTELHKYVIEENEVEKLRRFSSILEPLLSLSESDKKAVSLSIALRRYKNTLFDPVDMERKLMTAMMGLEAIYSLPSDRGEIGYRLGLRIAKLLSFLGFKPVDVRTQVEKSYYIRNRVAHGLAIDKRKAKDINDLLKRISEYLRISLILFLVLGPLQKNEFITLIDKSMIDAVSSQQIQHKINTITEQIPIEIMSRTLS